MHRSSSRNLSYSSFCILLMIELTRFVGLNTIPRVILSIVIISSKITILVDGVLVVASYWRLVFWWDLLFASTRSISVMATTLTTLKRLHTKCHFASYIAEVHTYDYTHCPYRQALGDEDNEGMKDMSKEINSWKNWLLVMATKQNRTQQYRIKRVVHVNSNVLQESKSAICDAIPWSLVEWVNAVYCAHVDASQVPQHCWWCVLFIAQPAL